MGTFSGPPGTFEGKILRMLMFEGNSPFAVHNGEPVAPKRLLSQMATTDMFLFVDDEYFLVFFVLSQ